VSWRSWGERIKKIAEFIIEQNNKTKQKHYTTHKHNNMKQFLQIMLIKKNLPIG
jgi:hypothetical protein